jgi:hypothetical protein
MFRWSLGLCIAAVLQIGVAEAASLDKETCDRLKTEQAQLEGAGARGNMTKGPEWAKANLAADKLELIKRLIDVDELLLFRCQGRPLVVLPAEVEFDPAAVAAEAKEDGKEPAAKDTKAPTPAKKTAAPPAKDAAAKDAVPKKAEAPAKPKEGTPAPVKAAKPKPKPDDAYRPPSSDTGAPAGKLSP